LNILRVTPSQHRGAYVERWDGKNWTAVAYFDDVMIESKSILGSGRKMAEQYVNRTTAESAKLQTA
jgi:hypothetical protein